MEGFRRLKVVSVNVLGSRETLKQRIWTENTKIINSNSGRMAAIGLVMAPSLHCFYRVLDTRKFIGSRNCKVLKKLAWDTAFIPYFSCIFMTGK